MMLINWNEEYGLKIKNKVWLIFNKEMEKDQIQIQLYTFSDVNIRMHNISIDNNWLESVV